ncbi:MAG: flavin reductase family protein [Anaerovoracaceae bacterium]|nr:flavin reductase family protein [Anaerovoracaceae bacterium]
MTKDLKREMRPGEMLYPVPVVMATLGEGDEANIITIAWTGIINSKPPMTYISVRKARHSHPILSKTGEFVINLCTEELVKATDYCGVKSGRDVDKFKEMGLTKKPADIVKCPMIKESPINLECKVTQVVELGSHDMFMAEIVKVHAAEELFDEEGRMDPVKAGLVAYIHGEYYPVKRTPLGKFGYSIMKPKTKKRLSREAHMKRVEKNKQKRK